VNTPAPTDASNPAPVLSGAGAPVTTPPAQASNPAPVLSGAGAPVTTPPAVNPAAGAASTFKGAKQAAKDDKKATKEGGAEPVKESSLSSKLSAAIEKHIVEKHQI